MGGCVQGKNKGSKALGDRAAAGVEVDVPTVTLAKDGHYVYDRVPYELNEAVGTQIWLVKPAEFDFLDVF